MAVDTNVLVRVLVHDDLRQAHAAEKMLASATLIAIGPECLCELVWVLRSVYGLALTDVRQALNTLLSIANIIVDQPAVEAGFTMMEAGGDFADGVIAYRGSWLGGETFVSFDRRAVHLLSLQGHSTMLLR